MDSMQRAANDLEWSAGILVSESFSSTMMKGCTMEVTFSHIRCLALKLLQLKARRRYGRQLEQKEAEEENRLTSTDEGTPTEMTTV